jgi:nitrate reductase molybdenum cofactor assembly chaperone NarJ/NarW
MTDQTHIYDLLAHLLSYPGREYPLAVRTCQQLLTRISHDDSQPLNRFAARVASAPLEDLEELFTRTFDLNPVCCLEAGWQLYGEDYNRGNFLVQMRQQIRKHGLTETQELPDHLSNVLPLLARMNPEESAALCASHILPAVKKMQEGLAGKDNPYEEVLAAVRLLIERQAAQAPPLPAPGPALTQIRRKEEVVHD